MTCLHHTMVNARVDHSVGRLHHASCDLNCPDSGHNSFLTLLHMHTLSRVHLQNISAALLAAVGPIFYVNTSSARTHLLSPIMVSFT